MKVIGNFKDNVYNKSLHGIYMLKDRHYFYFTEEDCYFDLNKDEEIEFGMTRNIPANHDIEFLFRIPIKDLKELLKTL